MENPKPPYPNWRKGLKNGFTLALLSLIPGFFYSLTAIPISISKHPTPRPFGYNFFHYMLPWILIIFITTFIIWGLLNAFLISTKKE